MGISWCIPKDRFLIEIKFDKMYYDKYQCSTYMRRNVTNIGMFCNSLEEGQWYVVMYWDIRRFKNIRLHNDTVKHICYVWGELK